jgi:cytochrome c peroxidase
MNVPAHRATSRKWLLPTVWEKHELHARPATRNAPTVINSVFQSTQFWDSRVNSLEDQADSVIMNPNEMHGTSFEIVAERITASEEYIKLFNKAFPETIKLGISRKHIKSAIASYERTLTGLNSRFDKYMRGKKTALSTQEINGFNVFMGKGRCGSCHYAPLFNGTLPPHFAIPTTVVWAFR